MQDLDSRILAATQSIPGISTLVVFGSRARGTPRPNSDLDVAVLPAEVDSETRRKLQPRVAVALADLAPEGRVDVVLLDEAPPLLRQRIIEGGRVVFCRDHAPWVECRVHTLREYEDMAWGRRLLRRAQRRRLLAGELDGRSGRAVKSLERVGLLSR
ncbi:MAG: nucleotidyltransferase domain-containing protein [bacterium]|nr:nucleotidyltransferase domain-containing protein [bacterium]